MYCIAAPSADVLFHPFGEVRVECSGSEGGECRLREGRRKQATLTVVNASDRAVRLLDVRFRGTPPPLAVTAPLLLPEDGPERPLRLPHDLSSGELLRVRTSARVDAGGCRPLSDRLDTDTSPHLAQALVIRYRVRGRIVDAELPLGPAGRILECMGSMSGWSSPEP